MAKVKRLYEAVQSDGYYPWLCDLIGVNRFDRSYLLLIKTLHSKQFVWDVPNDDNRDSDARRLREEFLGYDRKDIPCSVLEVLLGIAVRCAEITAEPDEEDQTHIWFWQLLDNLGLSSYHDEVYYELDGPEKIDDILTMFMLRTYKKDGDGGLFPLKRPNSDQRKVEIWYQMSAYLLENYSFDD